MAVRTSGEIETDEALVRRILGGSNKDFDRLYERHFPRVYNFVSRRVSNRELVEDLVQDIFIHAMTSLASYRAEASFLRWLYGITRNVLRRHYLMKARRQEQLGKQQLDITEAPDLLQNHITPEREAAAREIGRKTMQALVGLDAEARETFLQHHVQGVSIRDLSVRTSRTEDSLKSDFYRIRRRLMEDH
jgi:RNA polymerase sigma-70 factor (ECF subfamily)